MLMLIGASGNEKPLLGYFAKSMEKYGAWGFSLAWTPDLKTVRSMPEFVALAKQYNLPSYWRQPGHRPDICQGGNDEPLCKLI